jgi:hypothetical protein
LRRWIFRDRPDTERGLNIPSTRCTERSLELEHGLFLHTRQNVRVRVERDADASVAKSLAHDFRMDPGTKQLRRVAVP